VRVTVSGIKADVGSIGGHVHPSQISLEKPSEVVKEAQERSDSANFRISYTGDDVAIEAAGTERPGSERVAQSVGHTYTSRDTVVVIKTKECSNTQGEIKNACDVDIKLSFKARQDDHADMKVSGGPLKIARAILRGLAVVAGNALRFWFPIRAFIEALRTLDHAHTAGGE
jgi:hypothetical protein